MKEIHVLEITKAVRNLCIEANYFLSEDIKQKLEEACNKENWPLQKKY